MILPIKPTQLKTSYVLADITKEYCKTHKVAPNLHRDICKEFNKRVIALLLEGEALPMKNMGMLCIAKKKCTVDNNGEFTNAKLRVNFAESTKDKIVYHRNEHSDGYYFKYKWYRSSKVSSTIFKFSFKSTKPNRSRLAKAIKSKQITIKYIIDAKP